eukprot:362958_1
MANEQKCDPNEHHLYDLSGKYVDLGNTYITVSLRDNSKKVICEWDHRPTATGNFDPSIGKGSVDFPDHDKFSFVYDGKQINWSNGTSWKKLRGKKEPYVLSGTYKYGKDTFMTVTGVSRQITCSFDDKKRPNASGDFDIFTGTGSICFPDDGTFNYHFDGVEIKWSNNTSWFKQPKKYAVRWAPYLGDWKRYLMEHETIEYKKQDEIDGVGELIGVEDGKLYGNQLKRQFCEELKAYDKSEGHYSWILTTDGRIFYRWNPKLELESHTYVRHSDLNQGKPVTCAGEFYLKSIWVKGLWIECNNSSGHYKPDIACVAFVVKNFRQLGLKVVDEDVYVPNGPNRGNTHDHDNEL